MATNYFVCTLGQAALRGDTKLDFATISELISLQARRIPDKPAVGFAGIDVTRGGVPHDVLFTFSQVDRVTESIAAHLLADLKDSEPAETVALLCPSSEDFLFAWLALMRLGHPVLLLAPQLSPSAIVHLMQGCKASVLYHDSMYKNLAEAAGESAQGYGKLSLTSLSASPFPVREHLSSLDTQSAGNILNGLRSVSAEDTAYLHHTSGTSSGLPKPIPQSHRAGAGVLPHLPEEPARATFTTTPLYHGGIADLLRAWTSDAMIWLFPGKEAPITAKNILKCIDIGSTHAQKGTTSEVAFFSSVPYVLQMLASDPKGLHCLQQMDIVGVGGAALPAEVGDDLVSKGVNLISRFGSAECGFLMSSHRDYVKDKHWQYLRPGDGARFLRFEGRNDGTELHEMIILRGWPHMAKTNRDDGSYATADLFAAHSNIENAWKYHSRADSQLTLITGKKFDPAPLEASIATSDLFDDVLIFGNDRPFPGALLFRSVGSAKTSDGDLVRHLAPTIERLNVDSQSHARIPRNMLVPMPYQEAPLEKSSKGTVIRRAAEERYRADIARAYDMLDAASSEDVPDSEISSTIIKNIKALLGQDADLYTDTDLFSFGVDSVASVQIRYTLRRLLPPKDKEVPINIVEDCGTVSRLTEWVLRRRRGEEREDSEDDDEDTLMKSLVQDYCARVKCQQSNGDKVARTKDGKEVVILTGATGGLGAHILHQYREGHNIAKVYCLVRGSDERSATERVNKSLMQRGLPPLQASSAPEIVVLPITLSEPQLGLSSTNYAQLAHEATIFIHAAWTVNFRLRLRNFVKDHIGGLTNLLNFLLQTASPPAFLFISSTASAIAHASPIPEEILDSPSTSSPLGYARSKWVAENVIYRCAQSINLLQGRVAVLRVGQLSGDTKRGIWNESEAWPLMLSSVKAINALPDLGGEEKLDWLPVDVAAGAVVQIGRSLRQSSRMYQEGVGVTVTHVLNDAQPPTTWTQLLQWLGKEEQFEVLGPARWVEKLESIEDDRLPAKKLLGLWKAAYCDNKQRKPKAEAQATGPDEKSVDKKWKTAVAEEMAPLLKTVKPVDREYVHKLWNWISDIGKDHEGG